MIDFVWNKSRIEAARLVSLGGRTNQEIGKKIGVSGRQIQRWKATPAFAQRVTELVGHWRKRATEHGAAIQEVRIARLNRRLGLMDQLVRERAAAPATREAPGGTTGLVIRRDKSIGSGDNARFIEEYAVDNHLLREMCRHEEQIAREMGQWIERHELTGAGGAPISVTVTALAELFTPEELKAAEQKLLSKAAG